ncbi:hypothetical protein CN306_18870 [Bacillus thuringiensis]|nr:hypothetical protein CN306_18870 [Bacillus thuringiensis]
MIPRNFSQNEVDLKTVYFYQGDINSAKFLLNITHEGAEQDLSTATKVQIAFLKPDGKRVFQDCSNVNPTKGKYYVVLNTQSITTAGNVVAQIRVTFPDTVVETTKFVFSVAESIMSDDAVESSDDFPAIQKAIEAGEKLEGKDIDGIIAAGAKADTALAKAAENTNQIGVLSKSLVAQITSNLSSRIGMMKRNSRGFYAVHNVGDSISQGSASDFSDTNSWAGIVRKALQLEFNMTNYGFVNFYGMTNTIDILRSFSQDKGFSFGTSANNNGNALGFISLKSSTDGGESQAYFRQANTHKFKKVLLEVAKNNAGGNVEVWINGILVKTINCNSSSPSTEIVTLDTESLGYLSLIKFKNVSGNNELLNLYLINDADKVVFNNYANSGERMTGLTDTRIEGIFDCSCLFFSLGYNTVSDAEMDTILAKCKVAYNKYKPLMFVNDFCWDKSRSNVSAKLQQFAKDTGSQYIQVIEPVENPQTLKDNGFLFDLSHPTNAGHEIVANKILATGNTTFQNKQSISYVNNIKNNSDQVKEIYEDGVVVLSGRLDTSDPNYANFKDLKFSIEFKYREGSPTLAQGLYIGTNDKGDALLLYQDSTIYAISNALPLTKGDYEVTVPTWPTVKYDIKLSLGSDIDLTKIGVSKKCKVINGVVNSFTTKKTNLRDMLLYK